MKVELTAVPHDISYSYMDIVVLIPGSCPGGYSPVTLKPTSAEMKNRKVVFTTTQTFQLLSEFHIGGYVYSTNRDLGTVTQTAADIEIKSLGQSLRFQWGSRSPSTQPGVVPTNPGNVRVTLLSMRADRITDNFLNGDEDELWVNVYRGVGMYQRYHKSIEIGQIREGQTMNINKVLYEGPRNLVDIPYVAMYFFEDDNLSTDDGLGTLIVDTKGAQLNWDQQPEIVETSGQFAGVPRFHLNEA